MGRRYLVTGGAGFIGSNFIRYVLAHETRAEVTNLDILTYAGVFPEKVIPLFVTNLLDGQKVPLYGDGRNERDWLYVEDHCSAIHLLVNEGVAGEIYNIGANAQLPNNQLAMKILTALGKDESWIETVPDRPGHDLRYAVDSSKIRALGWAPTHPFEQRLEATIAWYASRQDWWRPLRGVRR